MHTQINRFLLRNRVQYGNRANLPKSTLLTARRERCALTTSPSHSWDKDLDIYFSSDVQRAKNYFVAGLYWKSAFHTAHYSGPWSTTAWPPSSPWKCWYWRVQLQEQTKHWQLVTSFKRQQLPCYSCAWARGSELRVWLCMSEGIHLTL